MKKLVLLFVLVFLTGCVTHPFLRPESISAALNTAMPYVSGECKEIGIYPGYDVVFDEPGEETHGFGGIVGGCGKYAHLQCFVLDCRDSPCPVECKPIENLVSQ